MKAQNTSCLRIVQVSLGVMAVAALTYFVPTLHATEVSVLPDAGFAIVPATLTPDGSPYLAVLGLMFGAMGLTQVRKLRNKSNAPVRL